MSGEESVSTVIPTYNREALVARAVESALAQARPGDEVIVIDDGSTDGTEARLRAFGDRIVYRKVPNGRVGKARNAGMDLATKPLLCFLDSDDEWLPGKQDAQRRLLAARPDVLFCFGDMRGVYPSGAVQPRLGRHWAGGDFTRGYLGPKIPFSSIAPLPEGAADFTIQVGDLYVEQLVEGRVQIGTLMIRRRAVADAGLRFPENAAFAEDAEFVSRAARLGPAAYMDLEVELFHEHGGERMTDLSAFDLAGERLAMMARVWGADAEFRARHPGRYEAAVDRCRLRRVRILLAAGRREEAAAELALAFRPPLRYRVLCAAPAFALALAAAARKRRKERTR